MAFLPSSSPHTEPVNSTIASHADYTMLLITSFPVHLQCDDTAIGASDVYLNSVTELEDCTVVLVMFLPSTTAGNNDCTYGILDFLFIS